MNKAEVAELETLPPHIRVVRKKCDIPKARAGLSCPLLTPDKHRPGWAVFDNGHAACLPFNGMWKVADNRVFG